MEHCSGTRGQINVVVRTRVNCSNCRCPTKGCRDGSGALVLVEDPRGDSHPSVAPAPADDTLFGPPKAPSTHVAHTY